MTGYRLPERLAIGRYLLRRTRSGDAAAVFAGWARDAAVTRFLTWRPHRDITETAATLGRMSGEWEAGRAFSLAAFAKVQPQEMLGIFTVRVDGHTADYGYALRVSAWGQGCASEIMRALVLHALSDPAIHRVEARCDVDNAASARVLEKAGMRREGLLRRSALHPNLSDTPRDCFIHARLRGDRCG